MKIIVKSWPENWKKEREGIKPATVRFLDGNDTIEFINTLTKEKFVREITDITTYKNAIQISFNKSV